jgi:hypothetical protein
MLVDAPARQNASAMHTSTSSRSNSGGGGVKGSRSAVSIHEIGKMCRGRTVPVLAGIPARFAPFRFSSRPDAGVSVGCCHKNRYDQRFFKLSLIWK